MGLFRCRKGEKRQAALLLSDMQILVFHPVFIGIVQFFVVFNRVDLRCQR